MNIETCTFLHLWPNATIHMKPSCHMVANMFTSCKIHHLTICMPALISAHVWCLSASQPMHGHQFLVTLCLLCMHSLKYVIFIDSKLLSNRSVVNIFLICTYYFLGHKWLTASL